MRRIWLESAQKCRDVLAVVTARFILEAGLEQFPKKKKLWNALIDLESDLGDGAAVLSKAAKTTGDVLYVLKYSKHLWQQQDKPDKALATLR